MLRSGLFTLFRLAVLASAAAAGAAFWVLGNRLGSLVGWLFQAAALLLAALLLLLTVLRFVNPPTTAFFLRTRQVLRKKSGGTGPEPIRWIPLERVSRAFIRTLLAAEDPLFFQHHGFDLAKIQAGLAPDQSKHWRPGTSTLTQQVAKNLFLWTGLSMRRRALRKPPEFFLALLIEALWPKNRILEIYVNIIQAGPTIFGVEAASQTYFQKPAASLGLEESASLVAVLPNPWMRNIHRPGEQVLAYRAWILAQAESINAPASMPK